MKNLTMRSMLAAVALVVAAGTASAQTYNAQIPMAFHAGGKLMAPGYYNFRVDLNAAGRDILTVSSPDFKQVAMVVPIPGSDAPKAWRAEGNPKIAFECADNKCSLTKLWTGQGISAYEFPGRKLSRAEHERLALVTFDLTKTE
jgi:hypothetical protein